VIPKDKHPHRVVDSKLFAKAVDAWHISAEKSRSGRMPSRAEQSACSPCANGGRPGGKSWNSTNGDPSSSSFTRPHYLLENSRPDSRASWPNCASAGRTDRALVDRSSGRAVQYILMPAAGTISLPLVGRDRFDDSDPGWGRRVHALTQPRGPPNCVPTGSPLRLATSLKGRGKFSAVAASYNTARSARFKPLGPAQVRSGGSAVAELHENRLAHSD